MTSFETLLLDIDGRGIATLTLNRAQKHNALDATMIRELTDVARSLGSDDTVRAVVLAAMGKSFCAGADLGWMEQQFHASGAVRTEEAQRLADMLRAIDEIPKLVIAVIDGAAYGGGVGLTAVCDVVIASRKARFALTETRLGLIPATIAPYLHRRIGFTALRRLALHGVPFDAQEGRDIGLVSEIAAADELQAAAERHIGLVLACAPGAIADAKQLFRRIANNESDESAVIAALAQRWESAEAQQGIAAFFNKREAPWQA